MLPNVFQHNFTRLRYVKKPHKNPPESASGKPRFRVKKTEMAAIKPVFFQFE